MVYIGGRESEWGREREKRNGERERDKRYNGVGKREARGRKGGSPPKQHTFYSIPPLITAGESDRGKMRDPFLRYLLGLSTKFLTFKVNKGENRRGRE